MAGKRGAGVAPDYDWAIVRLGAPGRVEGRDRHQSLQGQLSRSRVARRLPCARRVRWIRLRAATWSRDAAGDEAVGEQAPLLFRKAAARRAAPSRTSGSTSFRMAASAACAFMEPWRAVDTGADGDARAILTRACGASRWVDRHDGPPAIRQRRAAPQGGTHRVVWIDRSTTGSRRSRITRRSAIARRSFERGGSLAARFPATHDLSAKEQAGVGAAHVTC